MGLFGRTGGNGRHAKGGKNYKPIATSRGRKRAGQYGMLGNPFPTNRGRFKGASSGVRVSGDSFWGIRGGFFK